MAKGPGGTRVSTSDNPTGNGRRRVNASAPRTQLEIEDRIIALEGERDRLRASGSALDERRINQINDQIDTLRAQYQAAGTEEIQIGELPNIIRNEQNRFYEQAKKEFARGDYGRFATGARILDLTEAIRDANRTEEVYILAALRGDKDAQRIVAQARARLRAASEERNKRLK